VRCSLASTLLEERLEVCVRARLASDVLRLKGVLARNYSLARSFTHSFCFSKLCIIGCG
jgi:hypothetical protein